mmetsp:Transcript_130337/g.325107  ORF Transcript_130337/g.325107 Transcript_130337/m.325107 type:complete len:334 (+) Transcript_130337:176-1177(+)
MDRQKYNKIYADEAEPDQSLKFEHNPGQALILSIYRMSDPFSCEQEGKGNMWLHVTLGAAMHVFSMVFQFVLVFLIFAYPVEEAEDPWELDLSRETEAIHSALSEVPPRELFMTSEIERRALNLCKTDHTVKWTQSLLIFLWVTKMLPFLWKTAWCFLVTFRLPWVDDEHPLCYEDDNKACIVTHSRRSIAIAVVILVLVPQFLIDVMILWIGAKYLFFCQDLLTLITKSMAFFFVTQVDEVIYEGIGSRAFKDLLSKSQFRWHKKTTSPQWDLWAGTALKFTLVGLGTLYYTRLFHGDVSGFRELCYEYKQIFHEECGNCGIVFLGKRILPA